MPSTALDGPATYAISWLGVTLRLALPNNQWAERIQDLIGLSVCADLEAEGAEISVLPENNIQSYRDQITFATVNDSLIWLVLTCADVLAEKKGAFLLHAASFVTERGLVLVFGPPFSGKSTLAIMALQNGIPILGDDVIYLSTDDGLVRPVPRPPKRRILDQIDNASVADALELKTELIGYLDGKPCVLIPRSRSGIISATDGHKACEIVFMKRHDGAGIKCYRPERFEAVAALLDWARDWSTPTLAAAGWVADHLLKLDCRTISVGHGEQKAALEAIIGGLG